MSKRRHRISLCRRALCQTGAALYRVQACHLVFFLEPLPSCLCIQIDKIDLTRIVEKTAAPRIIRHRLLLRRPVLYRANLRNIIKKGRLLRQNDAAESRCRPCHSVRLDIDIRRKPQQQSQQKLPVGNAALCLHEAARQLPQIKEKQLILRRIRKDIHIIQYSLIKALNIFLPRQNKLRILNQILTVKGRQRDQAVHGFLRKVGNIRRIHQTFHLRQQPVQSIQPAIVGYGII